MVLVQELAQSLLVRTVLSSQHHVFPEAAEDDAAFAPASVPPFLVAVLPERFRLGLPLAADAGGDPHAQKAGAGPGTWRKKTNRAVRYRCSKSFSKQALHAIEASGRSERGEESDNIQARSSSSSAEESPLEGGGGLSGLDPSGILHREKRQSRRRGGNRWGSRRSRERNLCSN